MLITFWQRRLLIQKIEDILRANGRALIAGDINKLSTPQLKEVLAWVSEYPTMDSWLLANKETSWSEHAESFTKLNK